MLVSREIKPRLEEFTVPLDISDLPELEEAYFVDFGMTATALNPVEWLLDAIKTRGIVEDNGDRIIDHFSQLQTAYDLIVNHQDLDRNFKSNANPKLNKIFFEQTNGDVDKATGLVKRFIVSESTFENQLERLIKRSFCQRNRKQRVESYWKQQVGNNDAPWHRLAERIESTGVKGPEKYKLQNNLWKMEKRLAETLAFGEVPEDWRGDVYDIALIKLEGWAYNLFKNKKPREDWEMMMGESNINNEVRLAFNNLQAEASVVSGLVHDKEAMKLSTVTTGVLEWIKRLKKGPILAVTAISSIVSTLIAYGAYYYSSGLAVRQIEAMGMPYNLWGQIVRFFAIGY